VTNQKDQILVDTDFSIIRGGLLDRVLTRLHIIKPGSDSNVRKTVFYILITWIPLAVLSASEGLFWGNSVEVPFLNEFATHIRLLVVIGLLVLAEGIVDKRVKASISQFNQSGMLSETGKIKFEQAKIAADRMCESFWAEGIILVLIVANVLFRISTNSLELTTWGFPDSNNPSALSLAGYWAAFISLPLFQFILLRWFWRWIIWLRLLFLISKADLQLLPTHPDKSGGLGFLGESPLPFGIFTFALSIVFSAMLAELIIFEGDALQEHYPIIIAFVIFCIMINVAPLLTFSGPLSKARIKGISDYHALIAHHHREFEVRWIKEKKRHQGEIVGNPDASSAIDLSSVYELAEKMTIFPFNIKTMAITVVISLLPILAAFALQYPVADLIKMLAGILL